MTANDMQNRGAVVVTEASSGIGEACALRLDRLGFRVLATHLPGESVDGLRRNTFERLTVVDLDLTDPLSIASDADIIASAVDDVGLTGLVNNAGIGGGSAGGPLEFLALASLRRQLELNVIGHIAVTQALLPLIRQPCGRIVMMGSMAGELICLFNGPYSAAKAALHALTAALRVQLRPWVCPALFTPRSGAGRYGNSTSSRAGSHIWRKIGTAGRWPPRGDRWRT